MNTKDELIVAIIALLIGATGGVLVGGIVADVGWSLDCKTIGAHVYSGSAYDCKPRSAQ